MVNVYRLSTETNGNVSCGNIPWIWKSHSTVKIWRDFKEFKELLGRWDFH